MSRNRLFATVIFLVFTAFFTAGCGEWLDGAPAGTWVKKTEKAHKGWQCTNDYDTPRCTYQKRGDDELMHKCTVEDDGNYKEDLDNGDNFEITYEHCDGDKPKPAKQTHCEDNYNGSVCVTTLADGTQCVSAISSERGSTSTQCGRAQGAGKATIPPAAPEATKAQVKEAQDKAEKEANQNP